MKDFGMGLVVLFVVFLFGALAAVAVRESSPPEACPFFKQLDEEGLIEWYLDKDNNRKWKLKCSCGSLEREG